MTDHEAINEILKDMVAYKKKESKFLFIILIVSLCFNFLSICAFLFYESSMETIDEVTTTTTTQHVDGEGNDIVNGDQYNDKSQNKSGVVTNGGNAENDRYCSSQNSPQQAQKCVHSKSKEKAASQCQNI